MEGFSIGNKVTISLPKVLVNDSVKEVIYGLLYRSVDVEYVDIADNCVKIGQAEEVPLTDGESICNITEKGVFITAINGRALLYRLCSELSKIKPICLEKGKELLTFTIGVHEEKPRVKLRFIHICVFPDVEKTILKRMVRFLFMMGYTHIILEFWGTFRYDCLKELAWQKYSFSRAEVKDILLEIRAFGMEPVPMFNHFGHAAGARMCWGKHTIIDQNPRLSTLFSTDGWVWRIDKQEVRNLLRNVRDELIETFGEGEYFHIGFDEAFSYPEDDEAIKIMCDFVDDVCKHIVAKGRKPMLWGDLYLHEKSIPITGEEGYQGNCPTEEIAKYMIKRLPKEAIICDWEYFVKVSPWKTAKYFVENGAQVLTCPWFDAEGVETAIQTAEELNCLGIVETTWDKLYNAGALPLLRQTYNRIFNYEIADNLRWRVSNDLETATLWRKLWFVDGDFYTAGWRKKEMESTFEK